MLVLVLVLVVNLFSLFSGVTIFVGRNEVSHLFLKPEKILPLMMVPHVVSACVPNYVL